MAAFDGVDLRVESGAGGIFEIPSGNGDRDYIYEMGDGADVFLPAHSCVAIVRGLHADNPETARVAAREAANRALDMGLTKGIAPASLDHHRQPEVIWWKVGEAAMLRIISVSFLTMKFSMTAEVRDKNGNVVVQAPPPPKQWHESMRFYRMSESTSDLLDSFRNLYLAIEALLSTVSEPRVGTGASGREGEGEWLLRVLKTVQQDMDLAPWAPESKKAPYNAIFHELYGGLRTAIFHAKRGKSVWLPQEWSSREAIAEARQRYAKMFRRMANHYLELSFPESGMTKYAFEVSGAAIVDRAVVFVSDDATRYLDEPKGDYQVAPAGGNVLKVDTRPAVEYADDWTYGVIGSAIGSEVMRVTDGVRRFGTVVKDIADDQVGIVENLTGLLDVTGVDAFEVAMIVTNRNHGAPRRDFAS